MSAHPPAASPEPNQDPEAAEPTPMNRAERRAHARGKGLRPDLKTRDTGRHDTGPGKRQWTARRGGG